MNHPYNFNFHVRRPTVYTAFAAATIFAATTSIWLASKNKQDPILISEKRWYDDHSVKPLDVKRMEMMNYGETLIDKIPKFDYRGEESPFKTH